MQYDLGTMKKKYDERKIGDCVDLAKTLNTEMIERGEELVGLLWYLEKTKRYQEYDGYNKQVFKEFVWEICKIPYNRYRELAYAYNWFPEESRDFGPTLIQTIRSKVGVTKIPQVLREMKAKASEITDPAKKREAIYKIIDKYTPKVEPNKTAPEDTKAYWRQKHDDLLTRYKALERENEKLRAQIHRQKAPVKAFLAMKEAVLPMMQG